jgi:hypothetical protein
VSRLSRANASVDPSSHADSAGDSVANVLRLPGAELELPTQAKAEAKAEAEAEARPKPEAKVTLYHFPTSLCSQQVRLALAEKGIEW